MALTVSPFVSLPTAITLPYTYKPVPSTLPPSSTPGAANGSDEKPKYVVSSTGHAAHPDDIIASCRALQHHLQKLQDDADRTLREWEEGIKERELAEKRRLAPGWLDRDEKILEPERKEKAREEVTEGGGSTAEGSKPGADESAGGTSSSTREGEELDRAFGAMGMR